MDGIGWAQCAMSAARARLDVAAENLANASTDGFHKKDLHGFLNASGIVLRGTKNWTPGALRRTGRDLDLAIAGGGAFRLREPDGRIVTTRAGSFVRDRMGRLTDGAGRMLLGARGPVYVPQGARIRPDGTVVRDGNALNRIPLPAGSTLQSGFLEASNVNAIDEMIDVLTAQRSFETAEKVLAAIDQTRERAATQVAEVKG